MTKTETVKQQCKQLNLASLAGNLDQLIVNAQKDQVTYLDFICNIFENEINLRMDKNKQQRTKLAKLPLSYNLDLYDYSLENGISKQQLSQLRELNWLEQNFNIILMGSSGTGKTYIAAGLCFDAIGQGYRAYFKTMEELLRILKLKEVTRAAANEYKRIMKAHMLVIDDIMMFPVNQIDAVSFFNLVNELHLKTSLVITTNKSPKQWAEVLKDEVITTALLDRILHRCEIIKFNEQSYRMKYRKTIFENLNNLS